MSANNYSSSDEASSDGEISDWTDEPEENRYSLDQFEEEQIEGNEISGKLVVQRKERQQSIHRCKLSYCLVKDNEGWNL
uniref:Uncharacterized protein n=1 Tax=Ditylenchus dipsaci TaxID=166011 RepID=A0A915EEY9_9BILA